MCWMREAGAEGPGVVGDEAVSAGLCRLRLGIFSPLCCGGLSDLGTYGQCTCAAVSRCHYLCAMGSL